MATVRPPPLNAPPQPAYSEPLVSRLFSPPFLCPLRHQTGLTERMVHNTPLCLPALSPAIYPLACEAPVLYCLHRTKLHQAVTYAALVLLQRLNARFPTARDSSGHRLFISAFMIASKVICDDTYSNKAWSIAKFPTVC
ncbi:hypothetical protein B0H14DRAFT_3531056 [Mycena olivaceomarginata]|nr:hypothetical protein B0H14DRAFT_3531056 [Mycena olivaceomarginata]